MRRVLVVVLVVLANTQLPAQGWSYPSFQPPRLTNREYNFGVADAGRSGTSLVFQWREQSGPRHQLSFDVGLADPDFGSADLVVFGGGGLAWLVGSASEEVPLDFLFTAGAYLALGSDTRFRVPFGISIGKRFELDGNVAITPYMHPRITLDFCGDCGGNDLGLSFDLGANVSLTRTIAIRASALFAGTEAFDDEGFGVSIAWTPPTLSQRR
jgi:hypothetical protein